MVPLGTPPPAATGMVPASGSTPVGMVSWRVLATAAATTTAPGGLVAAVMAAVLLRTGGVGDGLEMEIESNGSSIIEYILGTHVIGTHIIGYSSSNNKCKDKRRDLTDGAATGAGDGAEESGSLTPLAASESAGQWLASMTAGPLGEGCFQAERLAGEAEGEGDGETGAWSCGVGSVEEESAAAGGSIASWLGFGWGLGWIAASFGGDPS